MLSTPVGRRCKFGWSARPRPGGSHRASSICSHNSLPPAHPRFPFSFLAFPSSPGEIWIERGEGSARGQAVEEWAVKLAIHLLDFTQMKATLCDGRPGSVFDGVERRRVAERALAASRGRAHVFRGLA